MNNSIELKDLISRESFIEEVNAAETHEEIQKVFLNHGFELSIEDVNAFINGMNTICSTEFDEASLENVSGGVSRVDILSWSWTAVKTVAKASWQAGRWFAKNVG